MKPETLPVLILATLLVFCLLSSCSQDKVSIETYNVMYNHLSQVWAQSLAHADAEIAFYGDSRVIGADWYGAYPDSKVVNLGIGGDKTQDLITRLCQIEALVKNGNLKYCFLAIGGNDCMSDRFDSSVFRSEFDELLSGLQALGLTVYVNTVAGITDEGTSVSARTSRLVNGRMKEANGIIMDLAALHGMTVIDMAALMDNPDGRLKSEYSSPDGVHFSDAGNRIWYDTLKPFIDSASSAPDMYVI